MSDKTTELREKLMERGVKYRTTEVHGMPVTFFDSNGLKASVTDHPDGYMIANIVCSTPEQAVEATLGSEQPCFATETNYKRCKYSTNRGWCDDAPMLVWDDTGHLFITMGGLKTWDVTDDAKKWFAELGSGNADTNDALALLDEIREAGRISYDDYSQLFDAIAELGSGTCEQVLTDCDDGLMSPFTAHCSACGAEWGFTPKFCHNCGSKVVGTRDERKEAG